MTGWIYDSRYPDRTKYYTEKHIYFENNTCAEIAAKSNFPWNPVSQCTIYYHGTDGVIDENGNPV